MPKRYRAICGLALTACTVGAERQSPTQPPEVPVPVGATPSVAGQYDLHRLNERLVPYDFGPIPGRDGQPSACHYVLRQGTLNLTPGGGFELSYEYRCSLTSDQVVARHYVAGLYTRPSADGLRLRPGNSDSAAFSGQAYGDSVVLTWGNAIFGFRRAR